MSVHVLDTRKQLLLGDVIRKLLGAAIVTEQKQSRFHFVETQTQENLEQTFFNPKNEDLIFFRTLEYLKNKDFSSLLDVCP